MKRMPLNKTWAIVWNEDTHISLSTWQNRIFPHYPQCKWKTYSIINVFRHAKIHKYSLIIYCIFVCCLHEMKVCTILERNRNMRSFFSKSFSIFLSFFSNLDLTIIWSWITTIEKTPILANIVQKVFVIDNHCSGTDTSNTVKFGSSSAKIVQR